jgi:glycine C-acetyltransferase
LCALELLSSSTELRDALEANTLRFREGMTAAGFDLRPGVHPICPVMLYDEALAQSMASSLLKEGVYVIGFSFPVVPKGKARIRVQLSAAHTSSQIDEALGAFIRVGKRHGLLR